MAAPENVIVGADVVLLAGGTLIGGQLGAQLARNENAIEILDKDEGLFPTSLPGVGEWEITIDNAHTESDGTHRVGANDNFQLSVNDGSTDYPLTDLTSISATLTAELSSSAGLDDDLWRYQRITLKRFEVSTTGRWQDPLSTLGAPYGAILDAQEAGDTLDATVTIGGLTLTVTVRPGNWNLDLPPAGDLASVEFNYRQEGEVTQSGSLDTGQQGIIDAWFDGTKVTALLETRENGTKLDGATKFEGDAWVGSIELSAQRGEALNQSYTIVGDGALTRAAQTVA